MERELSVCRRADRRQVQALLGCASALCDVGALRSKTGMADRTTLDPVLRIDDVPDLRLVTTEVESPARWSCLESGAVF